MDKLWISIGDPVRDTVRGIGWGGMREEAGWFVDDNEVIIFGNDANRNVRSMFECGWLRDG